jgi:hypothetical protein
VLYASTLLQFYTTPSHIDIPLTSYLAVGFSRALDLLAAFQPLPPRAASCVEALEDGGRRYPALVLLDREIFIYPAVHFWILTAYILALSTLAGKIW